MSAGFLRTPCSGIPTTLVANIPAVGWNAVTDEDGNEVDKGGMCIDVMVNGIMESDCPIVDLVCASVHDMEVLSPEWSKLWKIESYMGYIRCFATEVPIVDIPVRLLLVR